jgi:hypothetical protein
MEGRMFVSRNGKRDFEENEGNKNLQQVTIANLCQSTMVKG